jgi:alkylation response protein AidB-like acyl-CoA dehydrogenase
MTAPDRDAGGVRADYLIGRVEGQESYRVTGGLELGRINVAARGVSIAEGALQLAAEQSLKRNPLR